MAMPTTSSLTWARRSFQSSPNTPVLAGVNGTDSLPPDQTLPARTRGQVFAGIQNFPTVGLIDGSFRISLEETGMSYSKEIELVAAAREFGLLTTPYVFDTEQAKQMTLRARTSLLPTWV